VCFVCVCVLCVCAVCAVCVCVCVCVCVAKTLNREQAHTKEKKINKRRQCASLANARALTTGTCFMDKTITDVFENYALAKLVHYSCTT